LYTKVWSKAMDSDLPKRIRFDNTGDLSSLTADYSGIFSGRRQVRDSISSSKLDISDEAQSDRQMAEKQERLTTFNINKIAEIMIILNKLI